MTERPKFAAARLTARILELEAALEEYACPGLGKCPEQRLKDGQCIRDMTGTCGYVARAALDSKGSEMAPFPNWAELVKISIRLSHFYSVKGTILWLSLPHAQLDGQPAIDMIQNGKPEPVFAILERMEGGVYL